MKRGERVREKEEEEEERRSDKRLRESASGMGRPNSRTKHGTDDARGLSPGPRLRGRERDQRWRGHEKRKEAELPVSH